METKQLWVARNKDNALHLFSDKPKLEGLDVWSSDIEDYVEHQWFNGNVVTKLNSELFKEVTFENSPRKVFITIDLTQL